MSEIAELLKGLRRDWSRPREAIHRGRRSPFLLACTLDLEPANEEELAGLPAGVSPEVRAFWAVAREAALFKDAQYGQWGVQILSPAAAISKTERYRHQRARDFRSGDLVVGRFFGDSDLLVLRCDEASSDRGSILVALPLDLRSDWPVVARSFREYLEELIATEGDKYWEVG